MRILTVNNINQVAEICKRDLTRRGHSVTLYEPSLVGGLAPLPIKLAMMPGRILDMRHVAGNLNTDSFDIVHIHWASYGVLGLVGKIPFIVHCHGSDVRYRLQRPCFRLMLTTIFRRAAAVMCITPDLLPVVRSVRPDAIFFPAPIDTERFAPGVDNRQLLSQPWTILLFARLDVTKGVDISTQGIARFAQRHAGIRVQLLDWGDLRERYKRQYAQRFEFISPVEPGKVADLIRFADVIVGQVALGALGLSDLQAMSCAKPVIASFRYEDAYPTPPPLCQATSAEEVYEHLEYLFQHPEGAMALGQRAREWVIHNHDYRTLVSKLELHYRSIVEVPAREIGCEKDCAYRE
jgi:glycosyltransferase involved in cell wall biosynthesis